MKILKRLKVQAFSEATLDRELGINSLKKQLQDILKVRKFNSDMENKQIKSVSDVTLKRLKQELNISKDDPEKTKYLEKTLKEIEKLIDDTLNK